MVESTSDRERTHRSLSSALGSLTTQQRVVMALASFTLAVGLTTIGAYATFTASAAATHTASTATMTLAVGATGASTNRMDVDASGLRPGDSYSRSVDLINTGADPLSVITLTSTASPSSALDTDATNGLQVVIQRCSVAWTESGTSPNFAYACSGVTQTVLASRPVIGTAVALASLTATTPGATDHLMTTVTLPGTADNTFQGLSSTLTFTFDGVQ